MRHCRAANELAHVSAERCGEELPGLHLDHAHDVQHICAVWSAALPKVPRTWDDGICGPLVAHLLFGTEDHVLAECSARPVWKKQLVFRCGDVRGTAGQQAAADFCHDVAGAHYHHALRIEDLKWPPSGDA